MRTLQQLIDTYPRLLRGSGPQIEGYVGAGWHPIVMRLMSEIDAMLSDELAASFQLVQVKEKFGGLRFYFVSVQRRHLDARWPISSRLAASGAAAVPRAEG